MTWPEPLPTHSHPDQRYWEESQVALDHGVTSRGEFLELVYTMGSTPNGVFGAKLMWNYTPHVVVKFQQMPGFALMDRREVFSAVLPGLHVVHLVRRDRLRQAVSWLRAAEDGVWCVSDTELARPQRQPNYNYDVIAGMMALIAQGERAWLELYAELGVSPLEVVYEDLVTREGYENSVRSILDHLGLDSQVEVPSPRTHRQSDDLNEKWVTRFLEGQHTPIGEGTNTE